MHILGISCFFHDSAAALLEDGVLLAAAEEERFSRVKHDFEFPENAITFCLNQANITGKDLDYVVFYEKPFLKFDRILRTSLQGFPRSYRMFAESMRSWLLDKLWVKNIISRYLDIDASRILFSEHHISHAASTYLCSPFDEAAVLTLDGVGEWSTTSMGTGKGTNLNLTDELRFPHSIGLLYSAFTAFLGFEVNEGEYKVMGMAPYGTPKYLDEVWKVIIQHGDGSFWLDPQYFSFHYSTKYSYTSKFTDLFGEPRKPDYPFVTKGTGYPSYMGALPRNHYELWAYNQHYADIAASIQAVTEELLLEIARALHRQTGMDKLCMAGGVALNSVANSRILNETPFQQLYIQPSAGDGGGALGAALYAWNCALGNSKRFVMDHAYWGQGFSEDEVRSVLRAKGAVGFFSEDTQALLDMAVERLAAGKVIGFFQGRSEWGPRALGNRSILADPRNTEMKDLVNNKIKFREPFRPFAPSVLGESTQEFFDLPDANDRMPARFMLLVVPVHQDKQEVVPAVSHMGSSRIQIVHQETNPIFHKLISGFRDATGVPLLLNTSFNVRGEPIVHSPLDALNTFKNSGIDTVILGNHLIDKD